MSKFVHNSQQLTMYPCSERSYVVLLESCHKNAILHIFLGKTAYVAVEITELLYAKGGTHAHTLRRCMNIEVHMSPALNGSTVLRRHRNDGITFSLYMGLLHMNLRGLCL